MVARALSASYTRRDLLMALDHLNEAVEAIEGPAKELEVRLDAPQKWKVRKLKTRRRLVCALIWDLEGISRSTVKRNVMRLPRSRGRFVGLGATCRLRPPAW